MKSVGAARRAQWAESQRRRRARLKLGTERVSVEIGFDLIEEMRLRGRLGAWDEDPERLARAVLAILAEWQARQR